MGAGPAGRSCCSVSLGREGIWRATCSGHVSRGVEGTAAALCEFGKSADRYGLVHGDMLPENLFYDGSELRLIDWDDTGFGWHLYDFATALKSTGRSWATGLTKTSTRRT